MEQETIQQIRDLGYRVYQTNRYASWCYVESDEGVCYVQESREYRGYAVHAVYRPSREWGTGYRVNDKVQVFTKALLDDAILANTPPGFVGGKRPVKHKDMADVMKHSKPLNYKEVV